MSSKAAVLVGGNYPGTDNPLRGCVNDVKRMYRCLVERFGFSDEDITMFIDTDEEYTLLTSSTVATALMDMVSSAAPGDVLFFHFTGHGTRQEAEEGDDDSTGYDESIVLADNSLLKGEAKRDEGKLLRDREREETGSDGERERGGRKRAREKERWKER